MNDFHTKLEELPMVILGPEIFTSAHMAALLFRVPLFGGFKGKIDHHVASLKHRPMYEPVSAPP